MYKCKHYAPHELVPKEVYELFTNPDDIYSIFDENALRIIDMIREWAGVALIINNWFWEGQRTESGFRVKNSKTGSTKSAHKLCKAFDIISTKKTTQELWAIIEKNANKLPCKIRIERTSGGKVLTWLHIDTNTLSTQKDIICYFND